MARIRTIKPDFWTDEKVLGIKPLTRLLFIGMWNFADDYGRLEFAPGSLKAKIFPGDQLAADDVREMLRELSGADLLMIYAAKGKEYIEITGWHNQKIDKRQSSKIPGPFDDGVVIRGNPPTSPEPPQPTPTPTPVMEGKGEEGKGDSEANASGADAPNEAPAIDHRKRLFSEGLQKLATITGKGPDACRSFVGKCLKAASDDAIVVLGLIEDAERNQVVDPGAWISARLKPRETPNGRRTIHDAAKDLLAKVRAFDAEPPSGIRDGAGEPPLRLLSSG